MIRRPLLALLMLPVAPAFADEPPARPVHDARIDAAGPSMHGLAAVNQAAGQGNAQANLRSIAIAGTGIARIEATQQVVVAPGAVETDLRAHIGPSAFGDMRGVLGLNQAAGAGNAQLNLLALGTGGDTGVRFAQQVDAAALAATSATPPADADTIVVPAALRDAHIDAGAFGRAQGVLQINQTAGVGNASANAIVLQLPGGTP